MLLVHLYVFYFIESGEDRDEKCYASDFERQNMEKFPVSFEYFDFGNYTQVVNDPV